MQGEQDGLELAVEELSRYVKRLGSGEAHLSSDSGLNQEGLNG